MAPAISPNKSWEGFVGGVVAAIGMAFVILYKDRDEFLTIPESLVLGLVIALAAVLGDLFESAVKRDLDVKDSGRVLGRPRGNARPSRLPAVGRSGGLLRDPRVRERVAVAEHVGG
jgi:predicted CDP-diglyceride synthetase/phosphatidate cytidylyltransferase